MATVKWNQDLNAGQTWMANINLLNADGSVRDITDHTLESKIKRHYTSASVKETMGIIIKNYVSGNIVLMLSAEQTALLKSGKYIYDVEMTDRREPQVDIGGEGTGAVIHTIVDTNGVVTGATIVNGGSGYVQATTTITIDIDPDLRPHKGTNATATATVVAGGITVINITNGGSGFQKHPKERVIQGVITIRPEITTD
jgi:hypothetical protein